MIRKIDSNKFSLTILKVTTFSRIRQITVQIYDFYFLLPNKLRQICLLPINKSATFCLLPINKMSCPRKSWSLSVGIETMYCQIVDISLGTRCPSREHWLLISCSPAPHHVFPEGPLDGHGRNAVFDENALCSFLYLVDYIVPYSYCKLTIIFSIPNSTCQSSILFLVSIYILHSSS